MLPTLIASAWDPSLPYPASGYRSFCFEVPHKTFIFCTCLLPFTSCRLLDSFDTVPGHLTEDLHLYSLNDLTATRKGELGPRLAELTRAGAAHVERCMVRRSLFSTGLGSWLGIWRVGWAWVLAMQFQKVDMVCQHCDRNWAGLLFLGLMNS